METREIPWTFKTWLAKFKDIDLPIGDLATDVLADSAFPDKDDFKTIYSYLTSRRADDVVMETFKIVWNFYLASR